MSAEHFGEEDYFSFLYDDWISLETYHHDSSKKLSLIWESNINGIKPCPTKK